MLFRKATSRSAVNAWEKQQVVGKTGRERGNKGKRPPTGATGRGSGKAPGGRGRRGVTGGAPRCTAALPEAEPPPPRRRSARSAASPLSAPATPFSPRPPGYHHFAISHTPLSVLPPEGAPSAGRVPPVVAISVPCRAVPCRAVPRCFPRLPPRPPRAVPASAEPLRALRRREEAGGSAAPSGSLGRAQGAPSGRGSVAAWGDGRVPVEQRCTGKKTANNTLI